MKDKIYESELVWNTDTVISTLMAVFNILLVLFIAYHVVKLYRVLIRFLISNTKDRKMDE
jgi:Na+/alanine symporter